MRAAIVLGTRPEIIKMSPIVRELQRKQLDFFVLHMGQHYSYEMDRGSSRNLSFGSPSRAARVLGWEA